MSLSTSIIVDDEPLARKGLAIRLKAFDNINTLLSSAVTAEKALEAVRAY